MKSRFGIEKVSEDILIEGRALIVTGDENMEWGRLPDGSLKVDPKEGKLFFKEEGEASWTPYGLEREALTISKDQVYRSERFEIIDIDEANGEFRYEVMDYGPVSSTIENGEFIFEVVKGEYILSRNRLHVIKNDEYYFRQDLGNLTEVDRKRFSLPDVSLGDIFYVNYAQIVHINSPFPRIFIDINDDGPPPVSEMGDFWLRPNP